MSSPTLHRRILALVSIAAWTLPVALSPVHSEGRGHRYCEQHRAFEESDAAASDEAAPTAPRGWSAQAAESAAVVMHLPCPVAQPALRDADVGAAGPELVRSGVSFSAVARPEAGPGAARDVLRVAPKASPPRA
ncbi:MAG: hypothetical protein IRZ16_19955 [Myxococcaceae bacterium]|nr:hypothetical protein [Myxococcaceae bacterium]